MDWLIICNCLVCTPGFSTQFYSGLDSCADNDTALAGPGVYYENIIWPNTQGLHLVSEMGPELTIIDGDGAESVIQLGTQVDSTTTISGFTIRNGYGYSGGGVDCFSNSSPTIADNIITDNRTYGVMFSGGGGINCSIHTSPKITNNTITANTGSYGGGILCDYYCSATITGNTITGNTAGGGGGISCWFSSPMILDNTIMGNSADFGGGIYCDDESSPKITGNNIAANSYDGIVCVTSSSPMIDSCTISNNNGNGVFCAVESYPVIHYNNITENTDYGVLGGDSNIMVDAEHNWWGDPSGPGGFGPGTGDEVSEYVDYDPWLDHLIGVVDEKRVVSIKSSNFGATIICGPLLLPKDKKYKVYDITGRTVTPDKMRPGIYFIEIDSKITVKVVKVK